MKENEHLTVEERLTRLLRFCGKTLHHGMGGRVSQQRILAILYRHPVMPQRELMNIIGIQSGSMSEVLGKIEEQGLLVREKNSRDKRNADIRLTEQGMREARRAFTERAKLEQHLFETLTEEEKAQLLGLLEKVKSAWEKDERICSGRWGSKKDTEECNG